MGPRVHEEVFDSSIDDTIPINQSFKLPRVAQRSPSGKSVAKDNKVIDLDKGGSEGTGSDIENSDAHGSEDGEDNGADVGSENQSDADGDDEDHSGDDNDGRGEDDNDNNVDDSDGGGSKDE